MTNSSNNADDNALAYAAVSLFANPSRGAAPQWHELSAWREGTLGAERSDEILSHVANDPECFQQWLDIVEAEHWVEEQSSATNPTLATQPSPAVADNQDKQGKLALLSKQLKTRLIWLRSCFDQPLAVYGSAFAAIMLAVIIVPLMREGDIASLQQQLDRSLDTYVASETGLPASAPLARNTRNLGGLFDDLSQSDVSRQHFQHGMRQVAERLLDNAPTEWLAWIAKLPSSPTQCSRAIDQAECEAVAQDLSALGQWTLLNHAACQKRNVFNDDAYWSQQQTIYKQLSSTNNLTGNVLFGPTLTPLTTHSPDALCNIVSQLIAAGS